MGIYFAIFSLYGSVIEHQHKSLSAEFKDAVIIVAGLLGYLLIYGIAELITFGVIPNISIGLGEHFRLTDAVFHISILFIPFAFSLYLSRNFGFTTKNLETKVQEVQQLATEKHRIATDMHDDIGSDLSALNIKAERIRQKVQAGKQPIAELDNLIDSSRAVSKKVREVIWTINARNDSLVSIINYFDVYAEGFFEPTDVVVRASLPSVVPDVVVNGESRKVLLMCFKETLNNVLKHAKASNLAIAFTADNHLLTVSIQDNGVGFDPSVWTASTSNGNGLANLQERMVGIGGKCVLQTSPKGTLVVLSLPI